MNKIKYKLPSKDEMEKTIERYLGFMSSNITTLGDLDYSKIIKMQDRGVWLLEWEKSEEEIKELIDDFVNIYGYIYKEGKRAEERTPIEDTSIEKIKDAVNSEKEKLLETSDEELQEMIEKCISEYNDFIVQLEKYKQSNTPDKEQSVIEKMNGYKQDIQQMLKILCANREKNIDIQKQDKLKLEQILANDKIEVKETATTGVVNLEKIIRKYKTLSDILGIKTFN